MGHEFVGQQYRYAHLPVVYEVIRAGDGIALMHVSLGSSRGFKYNDSTETIINNIRSGRLIPLRRSDIPFEVTLVEAVNE